LRPPSVFGICTFAENKSLSSGPLVEVSQVSDDNVRMLLSGIRLAASSYSNTAPLIWSFLYGSQRGRAEMILDNAPARSAQLLAEGRVDAALVPVFAYQSIDNVRLIPDVCVGTRHLVQSVCLVTKGCDLADAATVALDTSSRTSAALTKIIFREFINREPKFTEAAPDIASMLEKADAALLIGDPALRLDTSIYRKFDLAGLWHEYTGLGFVFAMWMTRKDPMPIDLAAARNEGVAHIAEIAANYISDTRLSLAEMKEYLGSKISYSMDETMRAGLRLYFELAAKHHLIERNRKLEFI